MSHCYVLLQPAGYIGLCGWKGFPVLKQHHPKNKLAHAAGPWWGSTGRRLALRPVTLPPPA